MSASPKVAIHPAALPVDPAAEAAHLRTLIEKQPSCLMRVALDGTLLAVSDAALSLLAGKDLAQVLGTDFTAQLTTDQPDFWADFTSRVGKGGSASAECTLTDLAGAQRTVQLQGVALADHVDGVESMLVTARDVTAARRLEATLQEQEGQRRLIDELKAKLAEGVAAQQRLEAVAAGREAQLHRVAKEHTTERNALQQSLAEAHQLQLMQQERQAQQAMTQLRAELQQEATERQAIQTLLEQTMAEREAFEAALRDREAKRQKLVADHATARIRAEQALTEARAQIAQLSKALGGLVEAASTAKQILKTEAAKT